MSNTVNSTRDYESYLNGLTLSNLRSIERNIDRERYPDKYKVLVDIIERREAEQFEELEVTDSQKRPEIVLPGRLREGPWPLKDLLFGICIPLVFLVLGYSLGRIDQIRYRPWLLAPFNFSLLLLSTISLLFYPIYVFKKRDFGSLLPRLAVSKIFREFLTSVLLLFLISFVINIILKLLAIISETEITKPEVWERVVYAPNSILIIFSVVVGFTLIPVCEEIFFRGFLYRGLKTRFPVLVAVILQAVFFAALHHYDLLNRFGMFLTGIALAVVYEKRKNLLSPIFIHGLMNAIMLIPILVITIHNFHVPAATWEEARSQPDWLESPPSSEIERKEDATQQWQYAIDTWGSKGSREWKKEADAFNSVCLWFPEDRISCAKAKLGIVAIYFHYLRDYRRAIIAADDLLTQYPEQREQCASALLKKGWSYYLLKDFDNSKDVFGELVVAFADQEDVIRSARKGLIGVNMLQSR